MAPILILYGRPNVLSNSTKKHKVTVVTISIFTVLFFTILPLFDQILDLFQYLNSNIFGTDTINFQVCTSKGIPSSFHLLLFHLVDGKLLSRIQSGGLNTVCWKSTYAMVRYTIIQYCSGLSNEILGISMQLKQLQKYQVWIPKKSALRVLQINHF